MLCVRVSAVSRLRQDKTGQMLFVCMSATLGVEGVGGGAHLAERRTGTSLSQVRFPGAADFSPGVNFQ